MLEHKLSAKQLFSNANVSSFGLGRSTREQDPTASVETVHVLRE